MEENFRKNKVINKIPAKNRNRFTVYNKKSIFSQYTNKINTMNYFTPFDR